MDRRTIGATIERVALGAGDREAVVFGDRDLRWTYRALHEQVVQLAKGLIGLGIDPGDHVVIWATNRPEWILLQVATAMVGAVSVPLDPACQPRELAHVLEQSDATTIFMLQQRLATLKDVCPELAGSKPGRLIGRRFPRLRRVAVFDESSAPEALEWVDVLRAAAGISDHILRQREEAVDPQDTATIQYTSETSGVPKGVELTHRNLLTNAAAVGACLPLGHTDRVCVPVSFHRGFGSAVGTLTSLVHGATVIVPADEFDATRTLDAVAKERCTVLHGTRTIFAAILEHRRFATFDLSSLRTGLVLAEPGTAAVVRQIIERMSVRKIAVAYGRPETSTVITQNRPDDPTSLRVSTVGRPLPGVQLKVVDDRGREVVRGTLGELCCRGAVVMRGYYNMPEATAEVLDRGGWLHTGDLASMDEHGYYRIAGRVDRRAGAVA